MEPNSVSKTTCPDTPSDAVSTPCTKPEQSFAKTLEAAAGERAPQSAPSLFQAPPSKPLSEPFAPPSTGQRSAGRPSGAEAAEAYRKQLSSPAAKASSMSDYEKYKDDQLLRNPGGSRYHLDKKEVDDNRRDQKSFFGRIKKDISDALGNIGKLAGNFFLGSTMLYRDANGEIKETKQKGLVGRLADFCRNLASGLSFGAFHPGRAEPPRGFANRAGYCLARLRDAIMGDVLEGIPSSLNHAGKNLVLAGWNLLEVLPDATIGNFEAGRKLTTTIFDNGQVAVEYLTDVIPSGDAWLRVHAYNLKQLQPPLVYNLNMPEHYEGDARWQYVRNTPFRKSLETIGTLLADAAALGLIGQTAFSSNRHHRVD